MIRTGDVLRAVYDDRVRMVREWRADASGEYCAQVEIRIPDNVVRRASRSGNSESLVDAMIEPVSQRIAALERLRAYDARPRLTLGKRRGKR